MEIARALGVWRDLSVGVEADLGVPDGKRCIVASSSSSVRSPRTIRRPTHDTTIEMEATCAARSMAEAAASSAPSTRR